MISWNASKGLEKLDHPYIAYWDLNGRKVVWQFLLKPLKDLMYELSVTFLGIYPRYGEANSLNHSFSSQPPSETWGWSWNLNFCNVWSPCDVTSTILYTHLSLGNMCQSHHPLGEICADVNPKKCWSLVISRVC